MDFCNVAGMHDFSINSFLSLVLPHVAASVVGSLPCIVLAGDRRKPEGSVWVKQEDYFCEMRYSSDDVMARDIVVLWCSYGHTFCRSYHRGAATPFLPEIIKEQQYVIRTAVFLT